MASHYDIDDKIISQFLINFIGYRNIKNLFNGVFSLVYCPFESLYYQKKFMPVN